MVTFVVHILPSITSRRQNLGIMAFGHGVIKGADDTMYTYYQRSYRTNESYDCYCMSPSEILQHVRPLTNVQSVRLGPTRIAKARYRGPCCDICVDYPATRPIAGMTQLGVQKPTGGLCVDSPSHVWGSWGSGYTACVVCWSVACRCFMIFAHRYLLSLWSVVVEQKSEQRNLTSQTPRNLASILASRSSHTSSPPKSLK